MANEEQLAIIRQGPEAWNAWRRKHPDVRPDLSGARLIMADLGGADLSGANLNGAYLNEADLNEADLRTANLSGANLIMADLGGANLSVAILIMADLGGADLSEAILIRANFGGADLSEAILIRANFGGADLSEANFSEANLYETIFADLDLSSCKGLESCRHGGPCTIDHRTLQRSWPLPLAFLRGVGLPDNLIKQLPRLLGPAGFHDCFISYSSQDSSFASRLYNDLRENGVLCWYAPEDLKAGARILDMIHKAIAKHDKVLLVLSAASISSEWVEREVKRALAEERSSGRDILLPICIDDAVFTTGEAWAVTLRDDRLFADFRQEAHDTYSKALKRLLRDLEIESTSLPG